MSTSVSKQYVYRPKAVSLESFAISYGIVESVVSNHPLVEKLKLTLSNRGTDGSGFSDLQRRFNAMDKDGSRTLFMEEFRIAFQRCNLNFTDQEIMTMFYQFDTNDRKYIDYEEFMIAIRGPISYRRRQFIDKAFQIIDYDGRGMVDPEELIDRYDPTNHPDVKNGLKKSQEIFRDFLRVFDVSTEVEGKVTRNEFENYYFNLSASIERDDYFEQVICNAWRMDRNIETRTRRNDPSEYRHSNGGGNYDTRRNAASRTDRDYENNGGNSRRPKTIEALAYDRELSASNYRNNELDTDFSNMSVTRQSSSPSVPRSQNRRVMSPDRRIHHKTPANEYERDSNSRDN